MSFLRSPVTIMLQPKLDFSVSVRTSIVASGGSRGRRHNRQHCFPPEKTLAPARKAGATFFSGVSAMLPAGNDLPDRGPDRFPRASAAGRRRSIEDVRHPIDW